MPAQPHCLACDRVCQDLGFAVKWRGVFRVTLHLLRLGSPVPPEDIGHRPQLVHRCHHLGRPLSSVPTIATLGEPLCDCSLLLCCEEGIRIIVPCPFTTHPLPCLNSGPSPLDQRPR